MGQDTAIIIPAYNEGAYLQLTLQSLRNCLPPGTVEIIVVDDGSMDDTCRIADVWADRVICNGRNRGKGYSLGQGVQSSVADYFLFLDADLGESVCHAASLLQKIRQNQEIDLVIASFPPARRGGFGMAKRMARRAIREMTGLMLEEPLSGQRSLNRKAASTITSWDCGFGIEFAMTIDIARAGLVLYEERLPFSHRETGKTMGGVLHRGRQYTEIRRMIKQKRADI